MTQAEAKKRHAQLVAEIRIHDHAYHVEGQQKITDYEYDLLFNELQKLEKDFPELVTPESPTQRVSGTPSEKFLRVKHLVPMLSLDKIEACEHPTPKEEENREKRSVLQDENTVNGYYLFSEDSFLIPDKTEDKLPFLEKLLKKSDRLSEFLVGQFASETINTLANPDTSKTEQAKVLAKQLNLILERSSIYTPTLFPEIEPTPEISRLIKKKKLERREIIQLNRLLVQEGYPRAIKPVYTGLRGFDIGLRKELGRNHIEYVMEPKVDGVSISVHYRHGKFVLGVTRGDGVEGDDITTNLKTVRGIPLELRLKNPPALLEVRGEAYMATTEFEEINAKLVAAGEKAFPNARNATAGTLKQLDPKLVAQRPIRAVFYATGAMEGIEFKTHSEMLETLAGFGLPTQKLWWVCDGIEEVLKIYMDKIVAHYEEKRDLRRQLPYEIDGIVLKVNTLADWPRIEGRTRAPGYAIVHKPVPWITPAETVLKDITVQVGRTGVLTPVAELEPVFVQGSTVSRATLHNEDEIHRKDIRIGDTVVIRKAGMVIPEVAEVLKTKRPVGAKQFNLFEYVKGKCPACGGPIAKEKISSGDAEEVAWRCQNIAGCPAQLMRRVEYFAQRKALDIESLGGIVAEKLVERGLVKEPLDLFDLKLDQLAKLNLGTDGGPRVFGEKNATKVLDALNRARNLSLARWLLALGVPSVGETTAYQIAKIHKSLDEVAHSEILKQCLLLYEKVEEAKSLSPDSMINMGPIRKERLAKENLLDSELDFARKQQLKAEIEQLVFPEKEERRQRIEQQKKVNNLIEELVGDLQKAGVVLKVEKKEKQKRKNRELAPPILEVTANLELEGARNLLKFFQSDAGKKILKRLHALGIHPSEEVPKKSQTSLLSFTGKTFVLTGTLPSLSRDEASKLIRDGGGNVTGSVSKNTDYLLAGEEPGSKMDKAKELGVKILNEEDFLKMLDLNSKPKLRIKNDQEELF